MLRQKQLRGRNVYLCSQFKGIYSTKAGEGGWGGGAWHEVTWCPVVRKQREMTARAKLTSPREESSFLSLCVLPPNILIHSNVHPVLTRVMHGSRSLEC